MFNRVNLNEGKKHDVTQVAEEGLSEEEILKATKKKKSLINIYKAFDQNKDGKLDKTEIAAAMKLIGSMDDNENGRLSRKELKEGAVNLNEIFKEEGLDLDRKDVKNFLRSMVKTMKDHEMVSTDSVIEEFVEKAKAEAIRQSTPPTPPTPPTSVIEENPVEQQKPEEKPKPAELHSYTVQEGESFTGLIKRSLKAQGIENPTDEQIKEAKEKFKKDNDGIVRKSTKGVEFLPVGAKVKLEGNLGDKNNAAEQIKKYEKEHGAPPVAGNAPAKGDIPVRSKTISFTNKDHKTFEELAKALFKSEGIESPSKEQIKQRVEELKNDNKDLKDGDLVNKKIKAKVDDKMYDRISKNEANKKSQVGRNGTVAIVSADVTNAKKAFLEQLDNDGWAGKTADAVSVLWNSDNRESKVREDFKKYETQLSDLRESAKKGDAEFKAKFKEIYGIECNYENITKYKNDPTSENYIKAFGTKNNAGVRVADYNDSQQRGASAVKATAVGVVSGVAAVATGGTSLLATAAIAGGSAAAGRVAVEVTDMATNNKEGDMTSDKMGEVAKQAVVEGLVAGATAGLIKGASSMLSKGAPKPVSGVAGTADDAAAVTKGGLVKVGGTADDAAVAAERRLIEVKPGTGNGSPKAIGEAPKAPKGTGEAPKAPKGTGEAPGGPKGAKPNSSTAKPKSSSVPDTKDITMNELSAIDEALSKGALSRQDMTRIADITKMKRADLESLSPQELKNLIQSKGGLKEMFTKYKAEFNFDMPSGVNWVKQNPEAFKPIADKVGNGGLKMLNDGEIKQLSDILELSPKELLNITKPKFKELIKKFYRNDEHSLSKQDLEVYHEISRILLSIKPS